MHTKQTRATNHKYNRLWEDTGDSQTNVHIKARYSVSSEMAPKNLDTCSLRENYPFTERQERRQSGENARLFELGLTFTINHEKTRFNMQRQEPNKRNKRAKTAPFHSTGLARKPLFPCMISRILSLTLRKSREGACTAKPDMIIQGKEKNPQITPFSSDHTVERMKTKPNCTKKE